MTGSNNNFELNNVCEAVGCYARPTEKIQVNAGPHTVVSLFLCPHCVSKFKDTAQT